MNQKRQLAALIVLLLIAAVVWFVYFRRNQPATTLESGNFTQNNQLLIVENPHIRFEEIANARQTQYKSSGRNIFTTVALPPQVQRRPSGDPPVIAVNNPCGTYGPCLPAPPAPPKLPPNVKFFGYATGPSTGLRRAFFTDGEDVYIVDEGQLLLNRFRVLKVGNASLEFEEVATGRRGTAPLEEQAGPPA